MAIKLTNQRNKNIIKEEKGHSNWSIIYFLLFLFSFFVAFLFYLRYAVFNNQINPNLNTKSSNNSNNSLLNTTQIEDSIAIRVEESKLQELVQKNPNQFPLKNPEVKIYSDKIVISGKTSDNFLALKVNVEILSKVEDNKIVFEIINIKTAGVNVPKSLNEKVGQGVSKFLSEQTASLFGDNKIKSVQLYDKYLIAIAEAN